MTKRAMLQATQIMIAFQIDGDGEQDVKDLLKMLIQIGLFFWQSWQWISRKKKQVKGFYQDCLFAFKDALSNLFDLSFTFGVG